MSDYPLSLPISDLYSVLEFSAFAHRLGTSPECVEVALKSAGISFTTLEHAKSIVTNFLKMEVI